MSTYMAKESTVQRKWYILDAAGKPMGKTAALAAQILRGKLKPEFTPHVDCGDFVIILNAQDAVLTGNKLTQKYYYRHSGHPGGLKKVRYDRMMEEKPELAMTLAVRGMLSKNTLGKGQLTRLKVFRGPEHRHEAQKPVAWAGQ